MPFLLFFRPFAELSREVVGDRLFHCGGTRLDLLLDQLLLEFVHPLHHRVRFGHAWQARYEETAATKLCNLTRLALAPDMYVSFPWKEGDKVTESMDNYLAKLVQHDIWKLFFSTMKSSPFSKTNRDGNIAREIILGLFGLITVTAET